MPETTTVIIGAGHCGLAVSRCLAARSAGHLVLERGQVANSRRTRRWDSLRLLTPNWMTRLPGYSGRGPDPDGYLGARQVAAMPADCAGVSGAPVLTGVTVTSVRKAAGGHVRVPRTCRGRDILWWLDACGLLDQRDDEAGDLARARNVPSMQLAGSPGRTADLKLGRLPGTIGARAGGTGERFAPAVAGPAPLSLDLRSGQIAAIAWATGYRPGLSWLEVPVLDRRGRAVHDGGVTACPGLDLIGWPFLRRRKPGLIDGAAGDAAALAGRLAGHLDALAGRRIRSAS